MKRNTKTLDRKARELERWQTLTQHGRITKADRAMAAKLAALVGSSDTPDEARERIENAMLEFSMSTHITLYHPSLIESAFLFMCLVFRTWKPLDEELYNLQLLDMFRDFDRNRGLLAQADETA